LVATTLRLLCRHHDARQPERIIDGLVLTELLETGRLGEFILERQGLGTTSPQLEGCGGGDSPEGKQVPLTRIRGDAMKNIAPVGRVLSRVAFVTMNARK